LRNLKAQKEVVVVEEVVVPVEVVTPVIVEPTQTEV
jgi:hypothetical protein